MSSSMRGMRDQVYRVYLDFLETAEKKRHWNVFTDVPWDKLDPDKATADVGQCVEIFCTEELYVPDYTSRGLDLSRAVFGTAWFQTCWACVTVTTNTWFVWASKATCAGRPT